MLVSGFESADLHARSVVMAGSAGRDSLVAWSCNVEATGRGGADRLGMITQGRCGPGTRRALFGGAGDDRLNGNSFADLLVGGPGTDRADGYDGRDRWDAETERRCELPAAHVRATA